MDVKLHNGTIISVNNWTEIPKELIPIAWQCESNGEIYQSKYKCCDKCVPIYKKEDLL